MSGQNIEPTSKDLGPPLFRCLNYIFALVRILLAMFLFAPFNFIRIHFLALSSFILGLLIFFSIFAIGYYRFEPVLFWTFALPWLEWIIDGAWIWLQRTCLIAFISFLLVKCVQHHLDWRAWHIPWQDAHIDRFSIRCCLVGADDFPCLILGRGGSGKTTLAKVLQHDFLRRQIFKPGDFKDGGGEERFVVRSEDDSVGSSVSDYDVTWRPNKYKVGRLACAYDLPGQIKTDWKAAIRKVKNCRRVAIFNVVTNGYNASITKFIDGKEDKAPTQAIKNGKIHCTHVSEGKLKDDYITHYLQHIRCAEAKDLQAVVNFIKDEWKGKCKHTPKLILIHIINMADCWIDISKKLKPEDINKDNLCFESVVAESITEGIKHADYVRKLYECKFHNSHENLRGHFAKRKGEFIYGFLPASFKFGTVKNEKCKIDLFSSTEEISKYETQNGITFPYEKIKIMEVMKKASLGAATVKTLRALRKELYRGYHFRCWNQKSSIGHEYKNETGCKKRPEEQDLYDRWRAAQ